MGHRWRAHRTRNYGALAMIRTPKYDPELERLVAEAEARWPAKPEKRP
jgi:hypothetical protein